MNVVYKNFHWKNLTAILPRTRSLFEELYDLEAAEQVHEQLAPAEDEVYSGLEDGKRGAPRFVEYFEMLERLKNEFIMVNSALWCLRIYSAKSETKLYLKRLLLITTLNIRLSEVLCPVDRF